MATGRDKTGRKSKWDNPAPASDAAPSGAAATEAAHEAARKLNAMLAAKGKLNTNAMPPLLPPAGAKSTAGPNKDSSNGNTVSEEIKINDSPHRLALCKGNIQLEISKYSGASVSTKGQYIPAAEKDNFLGQRPLYLFIQSSTKDQVNLAIHKIQSIMNGDDPFTSPPTPPVNILQNAHLPSGMHFVQEKVFVGLDNVPPEFNLNEKIVGPGESYFSHIIRETGAKVQLRGRGSGFMEPTSGREAFEALYIYISHNTYAGLNAAKKLVENLVQTVSNAYQAFQMQQQSNNFYSGYGGRQRPQQPYRPPMYNTNMQSHHVQRYGPPHHPEGPPSYPQYPHPHSQYPPLYHDQPPQPRANHYDFHHGNPRPPQAFYPNQPQNVHEGPRPLMCEQFTRPPHSDQAPRAPYSPHQPPQDPPYNNKVGQEPSKESSNSSSSSEEKRPREPRKRRFTEAKQVTMEEKLSDSKQEAENPQKRKFTEGPSSVKTPSNLNTTSANIILEKPAQRSVSSLDRPCGSFSSSQSSSPSTFKQPSTSPSSSQQTSSKPDAFTMPAPLRAPRAKQATLKDDAFPDAFKAPITRPPLSIAAKNRPPGVDEKKSNIEEPVVKKTTGIALLGNYDDSSDEES